MSCEHRKFEPIPGASGQRCSACWSPLYRCAEDLRTRLAAAERERHELVTSCDVFRRQRDEAQRKLAVAVEGLCRQCLAGKLLTARAEAYEECARICEKTLPPGFRAMSQDWRDGYLVCQREMARAIRERGGK